MKRYAQPITHSLALSLLMAIAYSGLVATLMALHPGTSTATADWAATPNETSASPVPLPKVAAPGSLRLRMTLPYMPGAGAREAEQEI
jgi:hypothetical protein